MVKAKVVTASRAPPAPKTVATIVSTAAVLEKFDNVRPELKSAAGIVMDPPPL